MLITLFYYPPDKITDTKNVDFAITFQHILHPVSIDWQYIIPFTYTYLQPSV
jgi:hypothetical protein